uniref:Putative guanine nucleotide exchange factor n=1 Tax=Triatoma infestans TaxID=30076 RepID=A0A023F808_TRIIF
MEKTNIEELISEGKNKTTVYCSRCPSKILNPKTGTHKTVDFKLPHMHYKADGNPNEAEEISDYWAVHDMYIFENIGFSKTVDNFKYLICADCEMGPIGWFDIPSKESFVALSRVKHQ